MNIGPGVLCYVKRADGYPLWVGRPVTVLTVPSMNWCWCTNSRTNRLLLVVGIKANWLPPSVLGWGLPPDWLVPICGPNFPLELVNEANEEEQG